MDGIRSRKDSSLYVHVHVKSGYTKDLDSTSLSIILSRISRYFILAQHRNSPAGNQRRRLAVRRIDFIRFCSANLLEAS